MQGLGQCSDSREWTTRLNMSEHFVAIIGQHAGTEFRLHPKFAQNDKMSGNITPDSRNQCVPLSCIHKDQATVMIASVISISIFLFLSLKKSTSVSYLPLPQSEPFPVVVQPALQSATISSVLIVFQD